MFGRRQHRSADLAAIEHLVEELAARLGRIDRSIRGEARGASADLRDFVGEALARLTEEARAQALTVSEEASRAGSDAAARIAREVEARPLLMLAFAAGLGFLLGLASRR